MCVNEDAWDGFPISEKGDFCSKDELRKGHPRELNSEMLEVAVNVNSIITLRKISRNSKVSLMKVRGEMKRLEKMSNVRKWVPHV